MEQNKKGPQEFEKPMRINLKIESIGSYSRLQKFLFPLIVLVFGAVSFWPDVAFDLPYGQHQWRQCDAYSMALNYFQEDAGFFEPSMHFQHGSGKGSGRSVGEFTGTYWLNAQVWKFSGLKPYTMRWTHMSLWLLGALSLFAMGRNWFGALKSAFVTAFVSASPLIAFYAGSYLVNPAALGLVFLSWWLAWQLMAFDRSKSKGRWSMEVLLFLCLSFSVLLRPTMALGWIPIAIWALRRGNLVLWFPRFALPLAIAVGWVFWSKSVNDANGSIYFCTTIRPLWDSQNPAIIWRAFCENLLPEWYHEYVRYVFGFCALMLAVFRVFLASVRVQDEREKKLELQLPLLIGLMVLGLAIYFLLWFENLDAHDYYLIEFQLLLPLLLWRCIQVLEYIRNSNLRWYRGIWTLLIIALSFQLLEAHLRTRMKHTSPTGWWSDVILTHRDREVWSWFHGDQERRFADLEQVKSAMRAHGIQRDERIISVPDPSSNITLSLLDQKGFTDLYDENFVGDERIELYVQKGASYLVCNSRTWYEERIKSPWLQRPIIDFGGMIVFDLSNSESPLSSDAGQR
jgi:hypothetical protein|tara:strand:+ start:2148 stop:3857 length:1710 start_codon:yes stop_codon:yes gene_type:complete